MSEVLSAIYARCTEDGDCQIWQGPTSTAGGHPVMYVKGRGMRHVRGVVYYEKHGHKPPDGYCLSPVCGQKCCVNQDHIHAVTKPRSAEIAKRRGVYGRPSSIRKTALKARARSWITNEIVEQVKAAPSGAAAARLTGVSPSYAKAIRRGQNRTDFTNPFFGLL